MTCPAITPARGNFPQHDSGPWQLGVICQDNNADRLLEFHCGSPLLLGPPKQALPRCPKGKNNGGEHKDGVGLPAPPPQRPQREAALCGCALGTPWCDQKQGQSYFDDRSGSFRSRRGDRAAELTHENCHVVGAAFLRTLCRILILHAHAVVGDNQLNLIADLFHAQNDMPCPARLLTGVLRPPKGQVLRSLARRVLDLSQRHDQKRRACAG
jgi:hypothetical protein